METTKTCQASKQNGSRCEVNALADSEFCFFHDPSRAAERRSAQSLGGHGNRMKTLDPGTPDVKLQNSRDTVALLSQTINQVLKGIIDPRVGNSVGYLANILLRAFEENELWTRMAKLEALFANRPSMRGR
jgi:hypothetical protein